MRIQSAGTINILVDHGSSDNLGDTAMLEGVISRLLNLDPRLHVTIINRPGLRTQVFEWPRVSRLHLQVPPPLAWLRKAPIIWRWPHTLDRLRITAAGGGSLAMFRLPLVDQVTGQSVKSVCRGFAGLHVVGGGNLTDEFPTEIWRRSYLTQVFAANARPIVFTGQQIGPFRSRWCRRLVASVLRRAEFVGLREPTQSVWYCRNAGLDPQRYSVMGDDSFGLAPAPAEEAQAVLRRYGLAPGRFLAANVRVGYYAKEHSDYLDLAARLISYLAIRLGLTVGFVPISRGELDSDIATGRELAKRIEPTVPCAVIDDATFNPAMAKAVLGQAFGALGVSYHFCTFALSSGVPAVCIYAGKYYGQKAQGLCGFWGDDRRLAVSLAEANPALTAQAIEQTLTDDKLRKRLVLAAETAVQRWQNEFDDRTQIFRFGNQPWSRIQPDSKVEQ